MAKNKQINKLITTNQFVNKLESKFENRSEDKFEDKLVRLTRLVRILIVVVLVNILLLVSFNLPIKPPEASQNIQSKITSPSKNISIDQNQKDIYQFTNNPAVADIGFILDVQKGSISTHNTTNCSTPILPPVNNGCYFSVLPYSLEIPTKGTIFQTLKLSGEITKDAEIQVNLKDYDKGELKEKILTITKDSLDKPLILPEVISSKMGLYFTLWSKTGEVSVSRIVLDFANIDSLKQVTGKISPEDTQKMQNSTIFTDLNDNQKLDIDDKPWKSRSFFTGIKPVNPDQSGSFVLSRDENGYTGTKPNSWSGDENKKSLPAGKWLLVSNDRMITYSFVVKTQGDTQDITLTKTT